MAKFSRAEIRRIIGENCTDEMENALVALHVGVVDQLKDDLQKAKAEADKLPNVQKELDDLKKAAQDGQNYEKLYNDLKAETEQKAVKEAKTEALRNVLKEIGIAEKRIDSVLKISDLSTITLNNKGEIEGLDDLKKNLSTEWADFIPSTETHKPQTPTPPASTGSNKYGSKEDILKIKDTSERQRAIAANLNLFQKGV